MKTLLALVSLFLLASFLAVNPANALVGVCVDNMPGAPPCDDSVSTGPSTWVPSAPIKTPRDFARDAYNLALSYYRAGDFDQALTTAQQAIAYDASYSYPFNLLGNIYAERSDFRRALRLFEKALARENHEAFRANLQLMLQNWAWFALRANDLRTAEAAARSILAQNRGHRDALYILGRIREKQGDLDQAIFYYDRSRVDEANRLRERIAREQREEQERRYRNMIADLRSSADVALGEGRHADAIDALRSLLANEPNDSDAWHALGRALFGVGNLSEAADAYRRAGQLGAGSEWAENAVFGLYWKDAESRARRSGAETKVEIWQSLLLRYPGRRGNYARWRIVRILGETRRHADMALFATDILRLDPNNSSARNLVDQVKLRLVRDEAERAGEDGDNERAAAYLETAVRDDPADPGIGGDLVYHLVRQKKYERALAVAQTTLENAPDSPEAQIMMAYAFRASGDWRQAMVHAERAKESVSDDRYDDFIGEMTGTKGRILGVVGTILTPATILNSAARTVYHRSKRVLSDWGSTASRAVGSMFSGNGRDGQNLQAARSAKYFGSLAFGADPVNARILSGMVFDNGAMIPADSTNAAAVVLNSVSVEAALPAIEEVVPESVRKTPEWKKLATEKKALLTKTRELDTEIRALRKRYDKAPAGRKRGQIAVSIAEKKQRRSDVTAQIAYTRKKQRDEVRKSFNIDTTIKPAGDNASVDQPKSQVQ